MTVMREVDDQQAARELPTGVADLDRLVRFMDAELDLEDVVLEVGAGTGPVARAVARRVRHATALDPAPAALAEGKRAADRDGITNVTFMRGDAAALPWLDRTFTLVVVWNALHRAADPAAVVREAARVCRPGAALVVADTVRPAGPDGDPDRIERLRDPAHGALLTEDRLTALVTGAGAEVKRADPFDERVPLASWLARTGADAAARVREEVLAELAGGPATGLRPHMIDGEPHVTRTNLWLLAIAG